MKNKFLILLIPFIVCITACKKKNKKLHVPTHNGVYIGKFSFNSYPQYDFSDTFILFSSKREMLFMAYKKNSNTYSVISDVFGGNLITIRDYTFIPDYFPHQFSLNDVSYEKYKITAGIEGWQTTLDASGSFELTYVSEK